MNDVSKWIGDATVFGGDARAFCHPEKSPVHLKGAVPSVDVSEQRVAILGELLFFPLSENLLIFIAVQKQPFIGICGPCKCYKQVVKACKTDAAGQRRIPSAAYSRDPWVSVHQPYRFRTSN